MHQPRSVTHITLWIFQVLWGLFFSLNGLGKVFWFNSALWNQARQEVPWASAVPQTLLVLVGTCEFLGGIGLILPAMTRVNFAVSSCKFWRLFLSGAAAVLAWRR